MNSAFQQIKLGIHIALFYYWNLTVISQIHGDLKILDLSFIIFDFTDLKLSIVRPYLNLYL